MVSANLVLLIVKQTIHAIIALNNHMKEIVKNNVNSYRVKKNMTQEELAVKVGVTRQTIIAIEKGNYTPSVSLALKLSETFSVSVEKLFNIAYE